MAALDCGATWAFGAEVESAQNHPIVGCNQEPSKYSLYGAFDNQARYGMRIKKIDRSEKCNAMRR